MKEKHFFVTSHAFENFPVKELATQLSISEELERWENHVKEVGAENTIETPIWKTRETRWESRCWNERYAYIPVKSSKTLYTPLGEPFISYHWERVLITIIDSTRTPV